MFRPVDPEIDFIALEHRVLDLWKAEGTFKQRVAKNQGKPRWSFLDGPITANNPMGVHHAWGRTLKDLFLRFRAMLGHELRYQNGFDCQGLWVEVEVEKELGFTSKRDIERYGIAAFIERCKERVRKYAQRQTEQSIRLGYWMDWDDSYYTMSDENNYCIWAFLKKCHEQGWIYKGRDAMPWCPRCGTGISEHEIATDGYKEVTHDSVYVRFAFADDPGDGLLVWTTTPWTLAANVAAAVHPDHEYARVDISKPGGPSVSGWMLASLAPTLAPKAAILDRAPGSRLVGRRYTTAMDDLPAQQGVEHRVIPWTDVTEGEGTGIVHIAPGCGAEDFALGKEHGLALVVPIDDNGNYVDGFGIFSGRQASDVGVDVIKKFKEAGTFWRKQAYTHRYPHCWRCRSELLFRVVDEWFIKMDEVRPRIQAVTRKIRWIPEYGMQHELDWLENMHDWMISKKRYWGLALPIFECKCGWFDVIGSETELDQRAIEGIAELRGKSPHRPYVDAVKIACGKCGAPASRITDVGNPWLDAGIVPFSTLGYRKDPEYWKKWFPADFITESLPGQFRNWFYALLCMSTVLEDEPPFKTVLGHALVRDERGQEMHKSQGNAIWFDDAAEELGVDAMRWLYARQNPTNNVSFGKTPVGECRRRLVTLWNVYSFFVTYARLDGFLPASPRPAASARSDFDRWILSRLNRLVGTFRDRLSDFDTSSAMRAMEDFLEELSNWYLRRSRRRFWKAEADADKRAAYATLYECLETSIRLLAPIVPFVTEEIWQNLSRDRAPDLPDSVHLADYPEADPARIDAALEADMASVIAVVELGRAARQEANIKVRQPLRKLRVLAPTAAAARALERFADVKDELNVHEVEIVTDAGPLVEYSVKPDWRLLGARLGAGTKAVAVAVAALDPRDTQRRLAAGETIRVVIDGEEVALGAGEVKVEGKAKPGMAVREGSGFLVALDLEIDDDLRREGLGRDLVRLVQDLRKEAGLDVADRIRLRVEGGDETRAVVARWWDYVAKETLAERDVGKQELAFSTVTKLGEETVHVSLEKV